MIVSTILDRGHVCTMDESAGRRRRRSYSAQFKAEAVAACRRPGVSIAAMALERSMNANVLRRWVVAAERAEVGPLAPERLLAPVPPAKQSFVPVPIAAQAEATPIRVEIRRGSLTVSVQWPTSAMQECSMWLREVLK